MAEHWPRKMKKAPPYHEQPRCILCRKPIQPDELYHQLTHKGRKVLHAECYKKELSCHD